MYFFAVGDKEENELLNARLNIRGTKIEIKSEMS